MSYMKLNYDNIPQWTEQQRTTSYNGILQTNNDNTPHGTEQQQTTSYNGILQSNNDNTPQELNNIKEHPTMASYDQTTITPNMELNNNNILHEIEQ